MNIIREQREHVLTQNNTGNIQIRNVLEKTNKRIEILEFKESLHGDLDFTIVKELGFGLLREIIIKEGDVTSITNLPAGIKKLTCNNNLLTTLENLPESLEYLNVNNNYIEVLQIDYLKNLQVLHCASNRLAKLADLPESIHEIHCENNALLDTLYLGNVKNLSVLHISNTIIHIIYDFPEGVSDFVMENTPSIEFRNAAGNPTLARNADDADQKRKKTYLDALNEYFKMKASYEKDLNKAKRTVYEKAPTKKMGRNSVKAVKIPCVKCKRPVGTQFLMKNNKYVAICGDVRNPCNLDIQIYNGMFSLYETVMQDYKTELEVSKQKIICDKLDVLFSYISEEQSIVEFKKDLDEYNINNGAYEEFVSAHNEIYNNPVKDDFVTKKNEVIFKLTESVRALLAEYKESTNHELLSQAVRVQAEQISAEARNLRMLKYEVMEMDKREPKIENENTMVVLDKNCQLDIKTKGERGVFEHILVQRPCVLSKLEYSIAEPPNVIKFVK
jgi:hypothetical protein